MKRRRRIPEQPSHSRRTENGIVKMRMAYRLDTFPVERANCDTLCDSQSEQQQQRKLSRETLGYQVHSRCTVPMNR